MRPLEGKDEGGKNFQKNNIHIEGRPIPIPYKLDAIEKTSAPPLNAQARCGLFEAPPHAKLALIDQTYLLFGRFDSRDLTRCQDFV